jgi:Beta-lactamase
MLKYVSLLLLLAINAFAQKQKTSASPSYFPDAEWLHKAPDEVGLDPARLKAAVDFAIMNETKSPLSMEQSHYQTFGIREPLSDPIGPMKSQGEPTGIIIKNGFIIAKWGEPLRPDMSHSFTKSILSAVIGVAFDKGLIKNIDEPVAGAIAPIQVYHPIPISAADKFGTEQLMNIFDTPHNKTITWNHLLRQVSDWEGTLWGKPEWADRPSDKPSEWLTRPRNKPGTVYEYNDVRVNVLSLAALNIWRRPLPEVLKENIMDAISASSTWRWHGYDNSWIVLDGKIMQSVSGGGHFGGGMIISGYDMARFGYLTLRDGRWKDKQLLSAQWIAWSRTPTPAQIGYGFMNWFLNTDKKYLPSAPASAIAHIGNGTNMVYVDKENDLVTVVRWIDNGVLDGFVKLLLEAQR